MLIRRARTAPGDGAVRAHTRPLRRRVLTFGAAVAALLSLTFTGAAHAAPAPAAAPDYSVVITSVAHTNYLIPDDGVGKEGTYLQVYYRADHPFPRTFEFTPVAFAHGQTVYQWTITRTGNCAEVRGEAGTSVYLAKCQDRKSAQWWFLQPTADGSAWALVPYLNEDLAVTATYGDDNWAPLREMPGGNATASQLWYLARHSRAAAGPRPTAAGPRQRSTSWPCPAEAIRRRGPRAMLRPWPRCRGLNLWPGGTCAEAR